MARLAGVAGVQDSKRVLSGSVYSNSLCRIVFVQVLLNNTYTPIKKEGNQTE
jgi:hypothetical protein